MLHNYNQWQEGSEGFELFDWEEIEREVEEDKEVDANKPLEALQSKENIPIEMKSMKSHQKKHSLWESNFLRKHPRRWRYKWRRAISRKD